MNPGARAIRPDSTKLHFDRLEDHVLRPVARAHSDPEKLEWAAAIQDEYPPDMEALLGPPNVVRTGVAELYVDIPDGVP